MMESQGYVFTKEGMLYIPENTELKMEIQTQLIPYCPVCGRPMSMNLRADDTFVEDEGWHRAAERYSDFIRRHQNMRILFLEFGVGMNTPVIIKFGFHNATRKNKSATYACVNLFEANAPCDIMEHSICIQADCSKVIEFLMAMRKNIS